MLNFSLNVLLVLLFSMHVYFAFKGFRDSKVQLMNLLRQDVVDNVFRHSRKMLYLLLIPAVLITGIATWFFYKVLTYCGASDLILFTSDTLMRVIYANWSSLASERGLGFLEFVLRMLWTDQWQIKRMWHPIKTYLNYPAHITVEEKPDHFLTSRLRISIEDTVDTSEIIELAPILRRLVPANVVVKVHSKALDVELGDSAIGVGVYGKVYQVIDFSDHAAEPEILFGTG